MLCVFGYSVASAMTSEPSERYGRLTSVSSSVDIDQRDTVSVPSILNIVSLVPMRAATINWLVNQKKISCNLFDN